MQWIWAAFGGEINFKMKRVKKTGNCHIKIVGRKVPMTVWNNCIYKYNGKRLGRHKMKIYEQSTCWTTKIRDGCFPYEFSCYLMNDKECWGIEDKQSKVKYDVHTIHCKYTKRYGILTFDLAIQHKNPGSNIWQCDTPWRHS